MTEASPSTPLERAQHAEILELESQIRILNTKVSAAVDHAADLQDEIRTMKMRQRESEAAAAAAQNLSLGESSLRRMSTYFSKRPSMIAAQLPSSFSPTASGLPSRSLSLATPTAGERPAKPPSEADSDSALEELSRMLQVEKGKRQELEEKYRALQDESEVLSESLFEEANKMVSVERKEKHTLQVQLDALRNREEERMRRVEELEDAVERIVRVRGVLDTQVLAKPVGSPLQGLQIIV